MVILNSITIAFSSELKESSLTPIKYLDAHFIFIYTTELSMKIIAKGLIMGPTSYLRSKWNVLDFMVVWTAWLKRIKIIPASVDSLRILRILKPLKTISKTKKLKVMMFAMINAGP